MKRILLLFVITILSLLSATAQLQGDGSLANPYSGFLAGDFTISGTKYFNGNIYVDNETLTVAPGTKLIALQYRAAIFVSGTGRINAVGTILSPILFTADTDLDGITGEAADSWGNITITSSGTSQISYCTFERGRRDHVKFGLLGGGLRLASSGVTVTNTTFLNCIASKGGAIAVLSGATPSISGCTFLNNNAIEHGGAVYIEAASAPVITNCLFNGNSSSSVTLRGGTVASLSSSPRIVNSTIVYSTSPVSDGTSLYLENSTGAIIVNSVFWGGTNHIGLNGTPASVLAYNAIEGASS
ncbi:MAG: right-handed parallel beta-helix repeat-containing protein [Bacteroidales bacterium]|nr:right-handed parallel beta-helix repeat-containing protein [Bacteroidales bacterium]